MSVSGVPANNGRSRRAFLIDLPVSKVVMSSRGGVRSYHDQGLLAKKRGEQTKPSDERARVSGL